MILFDCEFMELIVILQVMCPAFMKLARIKRLIVCFCQYKVTFFVHNDMFLDNYTCPVL